MMACCGDSMEDEENGKKMEADQDTNKDHAKRSKLGWFWSLLLLIFGAVVITMSVLTILKYFDYLKKGRGPHHHQEIVENYANALGISMQFFDVQKCAQLHSSSSLSIFVVLFFIEV